MNIRFDLAVTPFNLEHTLTCGQSFRWEKHDQWWYGVIGEKIVKIKHIGNRLDFESCPAIESASFVVKHFRLDDDLPYILSKLDKDEHICKAIQDFQGLRIIRQEPWECLISYICATYKNIPAIREMILSLSKRFGRKVAFDDYAFYTFPKPEDIANANLEELRACKLGFRAIHVLKASKTIHKKCLELEALKEMSYERARRELLSLPGVGQKVADCVLLFSLDKLETFPVDVWMKRIMLDFYTDYFKRSFVEKALSKKSITPNEYKKISSFGRKYFGEYAGYAQEYLFCQARKQWKTHRRPTLSAKLDE